SRRRHTRFKCDWSSDVCSSDLAFVSFSRQQDRVARPGAADGVRDPLPAVLDPGVVVTFLPANLLRTGGDLAENPHRVLLARILRSEERRVGKERGSRAHTTQR